MLHVALYQPEIPPNTGNVIRLAANCGAQLHLIRPLGFRLDDRLLRRAGLDYAEFATLQVHDDWADFERWRGDRRLFAFTTHGSTAHAQTSFGDDDVLLFGPETRGLPRPLLDTLGPSRCLRLPMRPGSRSLNLSNAVAIAVYEAWRQLGFDGAVDAES